MSDEGQTWVYGIHAVKDAIESTPARVRRVWLVRGRADDRLGEIVEHARSRGIRVERVDKHGLDRVTRRGAHQGVAAQCELVTAASEAEFEARFETFQEPFLLVLEGVQDPRNLGACLRSAEAAGVDAVLLPKRGTAPLTPTVAKAASGALGNLYLVSVSNLARRLQWLQARGVWIVGGDGSADASVFDLDLTGGVALVMGGEGRGLRRLTKEHCDYVVSIPMTGRVSSLNVSVAAGILLFEVVRQRR